MDERIFARGAALVALSSTERGFESLPDHIKEEKIKRLAAFVLKRPAGRPPGSTIGKRPVGRPPKQIS